MMEEKAQERWKLPESFTEMHFAEPIKNWDEALPLGNGKQGCLIWGDGAPFRLSLDRGDLWDYRRQQETWSAEYRFGKLIELVREQDRDGIIRRFEDMYSKPTPSKIPAGRIELDFGPGCADVRFSLRISDALATISFLRGGRPVTIRSFLHATKFYGFLSITGDSHAPEPATVLPGYESLNTANAGAGQGEMEYDDIRLLNYPEGEHRCMDGVAAALQRTCTELEYAILTAVRRHDGGMDIAYTVASNLDGSDWLALEINKLKRALDAGFDAEFTEHRRWWTDYYWAASSITLPDKQLERSWYINNYLFGAASRRGFPPIPLQGIWTADNGRLPPWKGDYHNNQNTQQTYSHFAKANHMDEGAAMVDFMLMLAPAGREFARHFYEAPGLSLPAVMAADGSPLGGWASVTAMPTNHLWLCQIIDSYWRYSGDDAFLRENAYPFFKESAQCILHLLREGEDGKLYLPLSTSPERYGNYLTAWLAPNTNYDLQILKYFFGTLEDMAAHLGDEEAAEWRAALDKIQDEIVDENGVLMVAKNEPLGESYIHHGHAMAIYPLKTLDYQKPGDRKIIDATIAEMQRLGTGYWLGYSFPWMAAIYACAGNGEAAAYQLKIFDDVFCSQNGFNLNGDYKNMGVSCVHYRPFTLEANMAAASAVQEMLLQDSGGILRLFPAIPEKWKKEGAAFDTLRAQGGLLVSAGIKGGFVRYARLMPLRDGEWLLENQFGSSAVAIRAGGRAETLACGDGEPIRLILKSGDACTVTAD